MPPNLSHPDRAIPRAESAEPLLEVLEDLAPPDLHAAAWAACAGKGWYFGHGSKENDWSRFWKLDLDGDSVFDAIWQHVRPRCEALAGTPLRVIRQYANGHTYGLGGYPHLDDERPGTFTLLYYPNLQWQDGWDGETVFYDQSGEIALSVRIRPNRGIFFDSRILHTGRAPSRICPALRVTVAYKLEAVGSASAPQARPDAEVQEISRDGATRVYYAHVDQTLIQQMVDERLTLLGESVRLPGFRPGKVPRAVLEERYESQTRADVLKHLAAQTVQFALPEGNVASACELRAGAESGDMEVHITATYLPDLPSLDFSQLSIVRLAVADTRELSPEAAVFLRGQLKSQVLDHLDSHYSVPLFPGIVERELSRLWRAAEAQVGLPDSTEERASMIEHLRTIAERRLRLGLVVAEMARRFEIHASQTAELEDKVIDYFISQARVEERQITAEELHEMMEG